jgi:hypothetical protein
MLQVNNSVWEEVWATIKAFFNPELEGYTNFEFGEGLISPRMMIFGIFAGVLIASFSIIFIKTTLGRLVRELLAREAYDAETAQTLAACGLERHFFIRYALRHGYTLRRVVRCVEEETAEKEAAGKGKKPPNLSECHFYIPEKDRYAAAMRFNKNGSGYGTFLFVLLGCGIAILLIFAFLPQLLTFFDNVISLFSWRGNLAR